MLDSLSFLIVTLLSAKFTMASFNFRNFVMSLETVTETTERSESEGG